jgi:hypothetical protein
MPTATRIALYQKNYAMLSKLRISADFFINAHYFMSYARQLEDPALIDALLKDNILLHSVLNGTALKDL